MPRELLTDDEVLALSECCWTCGDGVPVAVVDVPCEGRVPICEKCLEALGEVAPLPYRDTIPAPPPAAE